ncbi:uncharacterized protein BJ171DRAFT_490371 [Polychytrium aggregatum]|uniref:uncharacterized protein n=1 Tax=Polychytrium aggregatum TaxID=110093 RepID=UPI0022FEFC40|nr:uncharacterized protein BJ171DRAFT_490371 [Polychytrium aggregatum]KAI9208149.1 hypothetical protein BJ171DRAFT_490371 [Polychytrium aggregatum]
MRPIARNILAGLILLLSAALGAQASDIYIPSSLRSLPTDEPKTVLILSLPATGHANPLVILAAELAKRGHHVTFITAASYTVPEYARNTSIEFRLFPDERDFAQALIGIASRAGHGSTQLEKILSLARHWSSFTALQKLFLGDLLANSLEVMKDRRPDVVVGGKLIQRTTSALGQYWDVPVISQFITSAIVENQAFADSFTPSIMDGLPDPKLTFPQAIKVLIGRMVMMGLRESLTFQHLNIIDSIDDSHPEYHLKERVNAHPAQPAIDLVSSEWGYEPITLRTAATRMGGMWVPSGQDLRTQHPSVLEWLESASRPVVYTSTGTMVMPSNATLLAMFEAFNSTTEYQTLWSLKKVSHANLLRLLGDTQWPSHIRVEHFVPQMAVLAHPSVKVFFTHGGFSSVVEGIWNGKPMLGVPYHGDQPYNIAYIARLKAGLFLDKAVLASEDRERSRTEIQTKLQTLLRDPSYAKNILPLQRLAQAGGGVIKGANIVEETIAMGSTEHLRYADNTRVIASAYMFLAILLLGAVALSMWGITVAARSLWRRLSKKQKAE